MLWFVVITARMCRRTVIIIPALVHRRQLMVVLASWRHEAVSRPHPTLLLRDISSSQTTTCIAPRHVSTKPKRTFLLLCGRPVGRIARLARPSVRPHKKWVQEASSSTFSGWWWLFVVYCELLDAARNSLACGLCLPYCEIWTLGRYLFVYFMTEKYVGPHILPNRT